MNQPPAQRGVRWALLAGNFTIGCGVMVVAGTLNDMARSLQVSVAAAGQLISVGAVLIAVCAPLFAAVVAGIDRRRLLTGALIWFGLWHGIAALVPSFAALLPVRAISVLPAAVFTPQAAAALGVMVPPAQRGQAITFILLGWSLASVLGMPIGAWVGETWGWRWAFGAIGALALLAALGVWRTLPDGVRPAALSRAAWAQVFTDPGLMAIVGVTVFSAAGQFTLFSYFAPYYHQVLGASPGQISLLFLWFGAVGVLGNLLLTRHIDRIGADRAVGLLLLCMAASLLVWPLGVSVWAMALVITPWALGCFASNAGQQARLVQAAPVLAPALVALNSSAMFTGQALGAASGGAVMTAAGWGPLHWMGLAWMLAAVALSAWATGRLVRGRAAEARLA